MHAALDDVDRAPLTRLIYSVLLGTIEPEMPHGISFRMAHGICAVMALIPMLWHRFGLIGTIRAILKVCAHVRIYYALVRGQEIISDGWIRYGRYGPYRVARSDCVIGPIWTKPDQRGKGYATLGLRLALALCSRRVYVDTWIGNRTSRACIEAAGFTLNGVSDTAWSGRERRLIEGQLNQHI